MKYFFIGFNKNASHTINSIFRKNKYKTQHSLTWEIDNHDVFSDTGILPFYDINTQSNTIYHTNSDKCIYGEVTNRNILIIKLLDELFPGSIFILNTRPIYDWVASRFKHCIKNNREWGMVNFNKVKLWLKNRDTYYIDVVNYFQNKNNFYILDISSDVWVKNMCNVFNLKYIDEHLYRSDDLDIKNVEKLDGIFKQIGVDQNIIRNENMTSNIKFNNHIKHHFQHILL